MKTIKSSVKRFLAEYHVYDNDGKLSQACKLDNLEAVKYLVQKGANVHCQGGIPIIHAGCINKYPTIVDYLVRHGGKQYIEDDSVLAYVLQGGTIHTIKYFIAKSNHPQSMLDYAFSSACCRSKLNRVKYWHIHGADIHQHAIAPLQIAVWYGNYKVVKYLHDHGVRISEHMKMFNSNHKNARKIAKLYNITLHNNGWTNITRTGTIQIHHW